MTETIPAEVIEEMRVALMKQLPDSHEWVRAALRAAEAMGWMMVPAEATEPMVLAAGPIIVEAWKGEEWASEQHNLAADMGATYRAMIAARPKVP